MKECVAVGAFQYEMVEGMFRGIKQIWGNREY